MAASIVAPSMLRVLNGYNMWATTRLCRYLGGAGVHASVLDAASPATPFPSIRATLHHILLADALWYSRLVGGAREVDGIDMFCCAAKWAAEPRDEQWRTLRLRGRDTALELDQVTALAQAQHDRWARLMDAPGQLDRVVEYTTTDGTPKRILTSLALLHALNHRTHHRGQVYAALYALGCVAPPSLDMPVYFAEAGLAAMSAEDLRDKHDL